MRYLGYIIIVLISSLQLDGCTWKTPESKTEAFLIAHRGGVVDSSVTENSRRSIEMAIARGYSMIEVDLRMTKDSVLIIQHDSDFKRFYGLNKAVDATAWEEIRDLKSSVDSATVMSFEEVLELCQNKIDLMIDNKIRGMNETLAHRILSLLEKYKLKEGAVMIGEEAFKSFFEGGIRISRPKEVIEENIQKKGKSPSRYFLFVQHDKVFPEDVEWAKDNNIFYVVGVNSFRYEPYKNKEELLNRSRNDIDRARKMGVRAFQIDSELDAPFFEKL